MSTRKLLCLIFVSISTRLEFIKKELFKNNSIFTFCHYPNVLLIRMLHAIHIAGLAVAPTAGKQLKHRLPVAIDIRNLPREFSNALFKKVFEAFLLLSLATI